MQGHQNSVRFHREARWVEPFYRGAREIGWPGETNQTRLIFQCFEVGFHSVCFCHLPCTNGQIILLCGILKKFKSWIILSMTEIRGSPPNSIFISHRISPSHRVRSFPKDFHFQRAQAIPIENLVSDLGYCMVGTRVGRNWWEKQRKRPGDSVEKRPRGKKHELTLGGGEFGKFFWCLDFCATHFPWGYRDRSFKLLPRIRFRIRFKEHAKLQLCFRRLSSSCKANSLVWSCEGFFAALVRVNGCVCAGVLVASFQDTACEDGVQVIKLSRRPFFKRDWCARSVTNIYLSNTTLAFSE